MQTIQKEMTRANKHADRKDFSDDRAALCGDLIELIHKRTEELTSQGFSPEMARFDCLSTVKMIVDEMHGQLDVGNARQEWYREYALFSHKNRRLA